MNNKHLIFVTGATGFLGSYLLRQLVAAGKSVRAMKRENSPMELVADIADQVEWVTGDILDVGFLEEVMADVSDVYHCAAMISFDPRDVDQMMAINVRGTANVVNIALHVGIRKMVHVSSIAALGRMEHQIRVDENSTWQTSKLNSNYAVSKFSAECEVWRGIEEGLTAAIINPSVILGAGFWGSGSCKLFEKVWKGLKHYPTGQTGFVDVRDVAKSMVVLMESDVTAERYVVNSESLPYYDFLKMVAAGLGKSVPSKAVSPLIAGVAWRAERLRSLLTGSRPLITRETAQTSSHRFEYDNTKIKSELGFQFIPVADTISETCGLLKATMEKGKRFAVFAK